MPMNSWRTQNLHSVSQMAPTFTPSLAHFGIFAAFLSRPRSVASAVTSTARRSPLRSVALATAFLLLLGVNGVIYMWIFMNKGADHPSMANIMQSLGLRAGDNRTKGSTQNEEEFVMQKVEKTKPN